MKLLTRPVGVMIHHSATRDTDSISFDAIRKFHMGEMGWDEIGYHFLIEVVEGQAVVFAGRGLQYEGAHCVSKNNYIGVCVVGDYDHPAASVFVDGKIEALVNLLTGLLFIYPSITIQDIHYHREYANKTCPGTRFPNIEYLRSFILSKVAPGNFWSARQ